MKFGGRNWWSEPPPPLTATFTDIHIHFKSLVRRFPVWKFLFNSNVLAPSVFGYHSCDELRKLWFYWKKKRSANNEEPAAKAAAPSSLVWAVAFNFDFAGVYPKMGSSRLMLCVLDLFDSLPTLSCHCRRVVYQFIVGHGAKAQHIRYSFPIAMLLLFHQLFIALCPHKISNRTTYFLLPSFYDSNAGKTTNDLTPKISTSQSAQHQPTVLWFPPRLWLW